MSDLNFSFMHLDVLREISNIGTGKAVASLSTMLNKKVSMEVPVVKLLDFKDVATAVGGAENVVVAVLVNINSENINGIMIFLIVHNNSLELSNSLLNQQSTELGEMELSALTEIGNILNSSYLGALAGLLDEKIGTSIPYLSVDMAAAILSVPAIEFGKISDKVLFIESVFHADDMDISGYFILVPDYNSFKFMFSKLGVDI